jgi:hypothetical protein
MSYDYFSIIDEGCRDSQRLEEVKRVQCPDCQKVVRVDLPHTCICPVCKGDYWADLFMKCSNCLKGTVYVKALKS